MNNLLIFLSVLNILCFWYFFQKKILKKNKNSWLDFFKFWKKNPKTFMIKLFKKNTTLYE